MDDDVVGVGEERRRAAGNQEVWDLRVRKGRRRDLEDAFEEEEEEGRL